MSGTRQRALMPYLFILTPLAYLALFIFWPLARQVFMSFTNARVINPAAARYIGLRNYERLVDDPGFFASLRITLIYAAASVVFGVLLGTVSALAIDRPFRGRAILRSILLFGWAVPNVATALIWLWMYNGQSGVFNAIAVSLGLAPIPWLTSVDWALPSIVIVTVWQVTPFVMLVMLAALQSVPGEVREAARVDGADRLNVFRAVTLPHIRPALQLVSLLVAIWSIRRFDILYLLTGGGPLGSTGTLVIKIRQIAFETYELGFASTYGVAGLFLALLVAAVHLTTERRQAAAR